MLAMKELTQQVIGMAMKIHRKMGSGFLESVYHNCMIVELKKAGIPFESKKKLDVFYEGVNVGQFEADLVIIVDSMLILELKAVEHIAKSHEVQVVNYLAASNIEDGLIINFGAPSLETKRKFRTYRPKSTSPLRLQD